jgi:hypothetical protein
MRDPRGFYGQYPAVWPRRSRPPAARRPRRLPRGFVCGRTVRRFAAGGVGDCGRVDGALRVTGTGDVASQFDRICLPHLRVLPMPRWHPPARGDQRDSWDGQRPDNLYARRAMSRSLVHHAVNPCGWLTG